MMNSTRYLAVFLTMAFLLTGCGGGGGGTSSGSESETESSSSSDNGSGNDNGTTDTGTTDTGTTGTGTTGTDTTGTGTTGNYTLTLTTTAMGVTNTTSIANVPKPADQNAFCNDPTVSQNINALATNGATLTINSCSFSGSTGDISATVNMTSPIAMTIPYTVHYVYQ